ncbi:Cytoplasmic tRNA 2-thiolation protein 1 [Melia azedarach]|uniref:Cytoplasmic tRNA 2-thiolation protein 1 n=1 Tax=Melia azedarach TaxID=155640 RepID=A0ACC1XMM2_MELAZ|nr:Cytoplasmic tRNA 2-thiolation protein 1 [Melia azedarach]
MSGNNPAIVMPGLSPNCNQHQVGKTESCCYFQMPLHYPRYKKSDYEIMPEWKLDCLLKEYGLPVIGDVNQKRNFAMGAFLWTSQNE